jgi:hypothetical protein
LAIKRGRIRLYFEGDSKDLEAAAKRSDKAISDIERAVDRYNITSGRQVTSTNAVSDSTDRYGRSSRSASKSTDDLDTRLRGVNTRFTALRNAVGLIKWPGMIAGAGYAAEGVGTLSAGVIGLTAALAPLAGALVAYPAYFGAFAQGAAVAELATFGVKGALQEMVQQQEGAAEASTESAKTQESAAEGVRSAEEQLAQAQGTSRRAQHELSLARREAVEDLQDLTNAAVNAGFGERRSVAALRQARRELAKAESEPSSFTGSELSGLQLGVEEAQEGVKEARLDKKRADEEANRANKQGVKGSPKVVEANRQLAESNRQVADASRSLTSAEKTQSEAMAGTGSAADKLQSKLDQMSPTAQRFTKFLFGLEPQVRALQARAAGGLLPGVEEGIKSALPLVPRLNTAINGTSRVLASAAKHAGEFIGSRGFGKDFSTVAEGNTKLLRGMGNSGLFLFDALRQVLVVAQPLVRWMSKSGEALSEWTDNEAKAGRESGALATFFGKTRDTIEILGSTLKNLAGGFLEVGKAAFPLGHSILLALNGQAEDFSNWAHSLSGRNELREYFDQAKPGIFEFGRLIKDVGADLIKLSKNEGFYTLTHEVRTQLLPVITELLDKTTRSFGPQLVAGLVQFGKLIGSLAGPSGPLTLFIEDVTDLLSFGNWMITNIPGFKTLAVTLLGMVAVSKAVHFVGMATGLNNALGLAKKLATVLGLIDTEQTAGGAGGLPIPGLGRKASSTVAGDAGEFGEKQALRDAGLIGGGAVSQAASETLGARALTALPDVLGTGAGLAGATALSVGGALLYNPGGGLINASKTAGEGTELNAIQKFKGLDFTKSRAQLAALSKNFQDTMVKLRASAALGLGGINAALETGLAQANSLWTRGTEPWRKHTASAMEAAVGQIKAGMKAGTIDTEEGQKEINRLLGEIKLEKGADPFGLANATVKSFKDVGSITAGGIADWTRKLEVMPRKAREQSEDSTNNMLEAWANGHPKLEQQIKNLTDYEIRKFGRTNQQLQTSTANAMSAITESVAEGATNVGGALENIFTNLAGALAAMGEKKHPHFSITVLSAASAYHHAREKTLSGTGKGQHPEKARGGFLTGVGRRDTEMVWAAPEEAFLTRHQQPEVETGLAVAKALGIGQSGSLDELFANRRTPHYMAGGGKVSVSGSGLMAGLGGEAATRAQAAANAYLTTVGNRRRGRGSTGSLWHGPVPAGVGSFQGYPVDKWIIPELQYAVGHGWTGHITSGYRTPQHSAELGFPNDEHTKTSYPGGAVDFGGMDDPAGAANRAAFIAATKGYRGPRLHLPIGFHDDGHMSGTGHARGGWVRHFANGGFTSSSIKHSGTLAPWEWAVAMLLAGFPAKPGVIAAGLGTIKSESSFDASQMVQGAGGHIGGWSESPDFGSTGTRLNPILASKAAFKNWKESGGFWQAWGQWEAEQSGLSGGGAGTYGPEYMKTAEEVIAKWKGGGGAKGSKKTAPSAPHFKAGHTGSAGGTYGAAAGAVTKHTPEHEVPTPGLTGNSLGLEGVAGLPAVVQKMLATPGLTLSQQLEIGETASSLAGESESTADDKAAALFRKPLLELQKKRVIQQLKQTKKKLKEPQTAKKKASLQKRQAGLISKLGSVQSSLQSVKGTIRGEGEEEEPPTEKDYAERELALAELTPDTADDEAARRKLLAIAEGNLKKAEATADPRDDIEAAQEVKALREAIEANNELQQQREAFEKERLENDKRLADLAEKEGPAVMSALAGWADGAIGGPLQTRSRLATPGVNADYGV